MTGFVSPVKNQGSKCASSYAFAAVGAIESAIMIKNNQTNLVYSEQVVLDCLGRFNYSYANRSTCAGGLPYDAMELFTSYFLLS